MVELIQDTKEIRVADLCQVHGKPNLCHIYSHDLYLCEDCAKDFFNRPKPLVNHTERLESDDRSEFRRIEELARETLANMQAPDKQLARWKTETRAEILLMKQ